MLCLLEIFATDQIKTCELPVQTKGTLQQRDGLLYNATKSTSLRGKIVEKKIR